MKLASALLMIIFSLAFLSMTVSAETIDQYQREQNSDLAVNSNNMVRQSFVPDSEGPMTKVKLMLRWGGPSTTCYAAMGSSASSTYCKLRLQITDSRDSTLGSTVNYDASFLGTSMGWVQFTITGVTLTAGQTYFIKISSPYQDTIGGAFYWGKTTIDRYGDGGYQRWDSLYGGGSWITNSADMTFETYMNPPSCTAGRKCYSGNQYGTQNTDCTWTGITPCPSGQTCAGSGVCSTPLPNMNLESLYAQRDGTSTTSFNQGDNIRLVSQSVNNGATGSFLTNFYVYRSGTLVNSSAVSMSVSSGAALPVPWAFTIPSTWPSAVYEFRASITNCTSPSTCQRSMNFNVGSVTCTPSNTCDGSYIVSTLSDCTTTRTYCSTGCSSGRCNGPDVYVYSFTLQNTSYREQYSYLPGARMIFTPSIKSRNGVSGSYNAYYKIYNGSSVVASNSASRTAPAIGGGDNPSWTYTIPTTWSGTYTAEMKVDQCTSGCSWNRTFTVGTPCTDADGDGYFTSCTPLDCNDANRSINPGAVEVCGNTVDENCDGTLCTTAPTPNFNLLSASTKSSSSVAKTSFLTTDRIMLVDRIQNYGAAGNYTCYFDVYNTSGTNVWPTTSSGSRTPGSYADVFALFDIPDDWNGTYTFRGRVEPCTTAGACEKSANFSVTKVCTATYVCANITHRIYRNTDCTLAWPSACGFGMVCSSGSCITGCYAGMCGLNAACSGTSCACSSGFYNLDGSWTNGCEVNLMNDTRNCGRAGNRCATGQVCRSGTCQAACTPAMCGANAGCAGDACACNVNFANADGNWGNGCEINLLTDSNNCGAVGARCSPGTFCNLGTCIGICTAGSCGPNAVCAEMMCACIPSYSNVDGSWLNGCEISLLTDNNNCGSVGHICAAGTECCGGGCFAPDPNYVCYQGFRVEADQYEYGMCMERESGGDMLFSVLEEGASQLSGGTIIAIPPSDANPVEAAAYLFDTGTEDIIDGMVCLLASAVAGPEAGVPCLVFIKGSQMLASARRDAHERCKYVNESDPFIILSGISANYADFTITMRPLRKAGYVAVPVGTGLAYSAASTREMMIDLFTNPAWDSDLRGDIFRDARHGDVGYQTLVNICNPENGYTYDCQPIKNSAYARWLYGVDFPEDCELKELTYLGEDSGSAFIATTCGDSDKLDKAYLYEYTIYPLDPVYSPYSGPVMTAMEEYDQLQEEELTEGISDTRQILIGTPWVFISDLTVEGTMEPSNTLRINVEIDDGDATNYIALNAPYVTNFVGATVRSLDRTYSQEIPIEQINTLDWYSYLLVLLGNDVTQTPELDWTIPSSAFLGERYSIEVYTKQCDQFGLVCGPVVSRSNTTMRMTGGAPPAPTYNITLVAPDNGASLAYGTQTFRWNSVSGVTNYYLNLYNAETGAYYSSMPTAASTYCSGGLCQRAYAPARGSYLWNVTDAGWWTTGVRRWSETRSLRIV